MEPEDSVDLGSDLEHRAQVVRLDTEAMYTTVTQD